MAKNELPLGLLQNIRARSGEGPRRMDVRLDLIDPDPDQPRKRIDPKALQELAATIRKYGVLQPIMVRRSDQAGRWLIEVGERRWRAAALAGLATIPACEAPPRVDGERVSVQVIENQHREALSNTDLARAIDWMTTQGKSNEEIAQECKIDRQSIKHYRALLKLAPTLAPWADRLDVRTTYELWLAWEKADSAGRGYIEGRLAAIDREGTLSLTDARRVIKNIGSVPTVQHAPKGEPNLAHEHVNLVPEKDVVTDQSSQQFKRVETKETGLSEASLLIRLVVALEGAADALEGNGIDGADNLRQLAREVEARADEFVE